MFFFRMIFKALRRQVGKRLMIALTIFLGAGLTTSMLSVMLDVGDKIKQELGSYGANIQVLPQGKSVVSQLYDFEDTDSSTNSQSGALQESELAKLKTIFWAYNIENFAPFLETKADSSGQDVDVVGTWFRKKLAIPTGEKSIPAWRICATGGKSKAVGRKPPTKSWSERNWPSKTVGTWGTL